MTDVSTTARPTTPPAEKPRVKEEQRHASSPHEELKQIKPKRVVSVSIGSDKRDHAVDLQLDGIPFHIAREGHNGDIPETAARFRELDGTVDALGMGGIDIYLRADGRKYYFREAKNLAKNVKKTPLVDGSGLKGPIEKATVEYMQNELGLSLDDKKVLIPSCVDRWGMAEGFHDAGCDLVIGDLLYTLSIPKFLHSWSTVRALVRIVLPIAAQLPFAWLYPTGSEQDKEPEPKPKVERVYHECDIIAGDWQYVRKYMPRDMSGKWIVTNTTTAADVELCRERGVELLVTSTPRLEGRSFGTNVIEATMVALDGANHELSPQRYQELLAEVGFAPDVMWLQQ